MEGLGEFLFDMSVGNLSCFPHARQHTDVCMPWRSSVWVVMVVGRGMLDVADIAVVPYAVKVCVEFVDVPPLRSRSSQTLSGKHPHSHC